VIAVRLLFEQQPLHISLATAALMERVLGLRMTSVRTWEIRELAPKEASWLSH
jgi:hypothetical protein